MQMKMISGIALCLACFFCHGQKKPITNETYKTWERLGDEYGISNDGKYVWCWIVSEEKGSALILTSTENGKSRQIESLRFANKTVFSSDTRYLLYQMSGDSIGLFDIPRKSTGYIRGNNFSFLQTPKEEFLVYTSKDTLRLINLISKSEQYYTGVIGYELNRSVASVLVKTENSLSVLDIPTNRATVVYQGNVGSFCFSQSGSDLAFFAKENGNQKLYHYRVGGLLTELVSNSTMGFKSDYLLTESTPVFNGNDRYIFFKLSYNPKRQSAGDIITGKVDVWSYRDVFIYSKQLNIDYRQYTAAVDVNNGRVVQIEDVENEIENSVAGNNVLLRNRVNANESYFNKSQEYKYSVLSLNTGIIKHLPLNVAYKPSVYISPDGNYILYFDAVARHLKSHEIATDDIVDVSSETSAAIYQPGARLKNTGDGDRLWSGPIWLNEGKQFLLYDEFDIWQFDVTGNTRPMCVTGGTGRKTSLKLQLAVPHNERENLTTGKQIIVSVFDHKTKNDGFAKIKLGKVNYLKKMITHPYLYYQGGLAALKEPIKAKNADIYLVKRQSANEAPNLVVTKDFITFSALTGIAPQKQYSWLTSQLIHWKMPDEEIGDGILYKPENFDSSKKYPVIFHYYEELTHLINEFHRPELSRGELNIPWYVSNGYVVFVPDIYRDSGKPGEGICRSVLSAVEHLKKYAWVDSERIGLQGHSFGGYETNYLITRSDIFAAAQSSAGPSDWVSSYSLSYGPTFHERGQPNLGTTPWERPEVYIENSPIFFADRICTPLLLQNNKGDDNVLFAQGIELYTALRRLQKPCWMLQYDDEGHAINDMNNRLDFTIRQQQFFDHYLKGKPAPLWMVEGINAADKGKKSGLQLDSLNRTP